MSVLKGILRDSVRYYQRLEKDLRRRLGRLSKGSVKRRRIKGHLYYYLQQRQGGRVIHRYLGRQEPSELIKKIQERRLLRRELAKVKAALRLIPQRKVAS